MLNSKVSIASSSKSAIGFRFVGIFRGRENEIRITPDNKVSVYNFIKVAGGQQKPRSVWERLLEDHNDEVVAFCDTFKF